MTLREYRTLEFPALDITMITDRGFFRDDGFVDDLGAHAEKIAREFRVDSDKFTNVNGLRGKLWTAKTADDKVITISYYLRTGIPLIDTFVQGHEQTHALHALDLIETLESKLRDYGYKIDLRSTPYTWGQSGNRETDEFVADIGGLYALMRSGQNPIKFLADHPNNPQIFKTYMALGKRVATQPA